MGYHYWPTKRSFFWLWDHPTWWICTRNECFSNEEYHDSMKFHQVVSAIQKFLYKSNPQSWNCSVPTLARCLETLSVFVRAAFRRSQGASRTPVPNPIPERNRGREPCWIRPADPAPRRLERRRGRCRMGLPCCCFLLQDPDRDVR